ncbi:MAG: ARMT1-like domain-containing protein [Acutalibacteraceae bacterium]
MEISFDCIPCLLKQAVSASRMATNDKNIQEKIIFESLDILSKYNDYCCSPDLARDIHSAVKKHTKVEDPYNEIKQRDIKSAKSVYPALKEFLDQKNNELYWALKISATGNIIDSAISNFIDIKGCALAEAEKDFGVCDIKDFEEKIKNAKTILILGDNSGETVFDKVLIENLAPKNVVYAVRGEPILNDATMSEAIQSGLDECATIISSGCDSPGTILDRCNSEFVELFYNADVVISKGQGNFESLSSCNREVYFLLKAKCGMVAELLEVNVNDYVFKMHTA